MQVTKLPKFHGVAPALVTPMHQDRSIDWKALSALINHVSQGGVDYLVVQGTTGESATTTSDEKKKIIETIKESNAYQLPIVYGIGGNDTESLLTQIKNTSFDGIDAILSVAPYYNKPSSRGVNEHFNAIADACPVPVILYNIPGRTGINLSPETVLALAEHSNIVGIKEASCIIEQCIEIAFNKPKDFLLISGVGVMSVIANALPNKFSEMIHHALKGDFVSAQKILGHFLAIDSYLYEEGNPVGVKLILEHLGLMKSQVRRPLASGSNELKIKLVNRCKQEKLI